MNEPLMTLVGNLTTDPELRFTPNAVAVTTFTIASTPRRIDRNTGEIVNGETLFMRCSVWREYAEHVVESLAKGTHVIASGVVRSHTFETREGEKRTVLEMDVHEIGPALRFATAQVRKLTRREAPGGATPTARRPAAHSAASQHADDGHDPWSMPAGGYPSADEPPF